MSWFSELVDTSTGTKTNWNPADSPLWTNTSADPTKGTFGKENAKWAGGGAGGAAGAGLGLAGGMALGMDPGLATILGTVIGAKEGWDSGDKVAKIPFGNDTPKNDVNNTGPASNNITTNGVVGQNGQAARALEETLRSQKRMERPKNVEQTFNLESSLNNKFGQAQKGV